MSNISNSLDKSVGASLSLPTGKLSPLEDTVNKAVSKGKIFTGFGSVSLAASLSGIAAKFAYGSAISAPILPLSIALGIISLIFFIGGIVALYLGKQMQSDLLQTKPTEDAGLCPERLTASQSQFSGYLEDWAGYTSNMQVLQAMSINSSSVIEIAFASFNGSGGQLDGMTETQAQLTAIINYVHSKGGKVNISSGGATQPYWLSSALQNSTPSAIAANLAAAVTNYGFDGIDLDIEEPNASALAGFGANAAEFINALRANLGPTVPISLTVPGQCTNQSTYWPTMIANSKASVTTVNFMEYYITLSPGNSIVQQAEADMQSYATIFGLSMSQMSMGLMPGTSVPGNVLTIMDATQLAEWAVQVGLGGVSMWDLNDDYSGADGGGGNDEFANVIQAVLNTSDTSFKRVPKRVRG